MSTGLYLLQLYTLHPYYVHLLQVAHSIVGTSLDRRVIRPTVWMDGIADG